MNTQLSGSRDGATFNPARDTSRLNVQAQRVWNVMLAGEWVSLELISDLTGAPEASVSARLRDFRKTKFGGHTVDRRYVEQGLYEYRLTVN